MPGLQIMMAHPVMIMICVRKTIYAKMEFAREHRSHVFHARHVMAVVALSSLSSV